MKKILLSNRLFVVFLLALLVFSVASCGKKTDTSGETTADTSAVINTEEMESGTKDTLTDDETDAVTEKSPSDNHPYENVTLGGVPLGYYALDGSSSMDFAALLIKKTGKTMSAGEAKGKIVIKRVDNISYRGVRAKLDENTVTLTVHNYGATEKEALDFFMSLIENRESDEITKLEAEGVCMGGEGKLSNTYYRLTEDKELNIAYLGGSITFGQGDGANESNCWAGLTTAWFRKNFPNAKINDCNAGIGDSTSDYGLFRLERDVFKDEDGRDFIPDLFFIEYTSNDAMPLEATNAYTEAIIQNVYAKNPYCDIIFLYTKQNNEDSSFESMNVYKADHALAEKYGLIEMAPGRLLYHMMIDQFGTHKNTDLADAANAVHPSAKGYAIYMELISEYLDHYLISDAPETAKYEKAALIDGTGLMMNPHIYPIEDVTLKLEGGWDYTTGHQISRGRKAKKDVTWLTAEKDGASFTFEFDGTGFGLMLARIEAGQNADFSYSVDGGAYKDFSVGSNYTHMRTKTPEYALKDGHHTVTVKVKAGENGSVLNVIALMINGTISK